VKELPVFGAMLQELNWESLASRRLAVMLAWYCSTKSTMDCYQWICHDATWIKIPFWTNSQGKFTVPSIIFGWLPKESFFYHTVKDWNCLPEETVCASSPESFRAHVSPQSDTNRLVKGRRDSSVRNRGHRSLFYLHKFTCTNCFLAIEHSALPARWPLMVRSLQLYEVGPSHRRRRRELPQTFSK